MVNNHVFKAISVYFSTHTKMVGGDYSQNEKAHTYVQPGLLIWRDLEFGVDTYFVQVD